MSTFYHVTSKANVAGILKDGLLPDWGDWGYGVYLWSSLKWAKQYAKRSGWDGSLKDPVILEVQTSGAIQGEIEQSWKEDSDVEKYEHIWFVPVDEDEDDPIDAKITALNSTTKDIKANPDQDMLDMIIAAMAAESNGDTALRNKIANKMFSLKRLRKIDLDGTIVETWWDGQSRNYVTMITDKDDNEVAPSEYAGHKGDAAVSHLWAIRRAMEAKE